MPLRSLIYVFFFFFLESYAQSISFEWIMSIREFSKDFL